MYRDIAHEQVSASSDAELAARYAELRARHDRRGGLPLDLLQEFQQIKSELWSRAHGVASAPWVTVTGAAVDAFLKGGRA